MRQKHISRSVQACPDLWNVPFLGINAKIEGHFYVVLESLVRNAMGDDVLDWLST
jgi:hypothetical protein